MLTSFFGKSKPINFLIVSMFIIIGCFFRIIIDTGEQYNLQIFTRQFITLLICFFSLFLLNFIIRKNRLTKINTYPILLFSCLIILIPAVFSETNLLLANLFLLLSLRRILSLTSEKNLEKKILDASIWISIASLFYFWSILFFIILIIALFQRGIKTIRYWFQLGKLSYF